jgi:PAS domain S-box-containing protein
MGYQVVALASTGQEAIDKAAKTRPDLVLMDIRLKGVMDGIESAEQITAQLDIPVTYLTAYADEDTLGRAKTTLPYGYILKPFEEKDLRTAIELALYKHRMESMLTAMEGWHATALRSIPDAVIAVDKNARISFMNHEAESRFGWSLPNIYGMPLSACIISEIPLDEALQKQTFLRPETPITLSAKNGQPVKVRYSLSPIKDNAGQVTGALLVFYPSDLERKVSSAISAKY